MAQLAASIVSHDEEFKRQVARLLRAGGVPVVIIEGREDAAHPTSSSSTSAPTRRPGWRPSSAPAPATTRCPSSRLPPPPDPELILVGDARRRERVLRLDARWPDPGLARDGRVLPRRGPQVAARRDATSAGSKQPCVTHLFLGTKGGAGTTTVAVNCAVELARLSKRPTVILDLKPASARSRCSSGSDPASRCSTRSRTCTASTRSSCSELVSKHKSGLDILGGFRTVRSPERARCRSDRRAAAGARPLLRAHRDRRRQRDQRLRGRCELYAAETVFLVANPDVPVDSQRPAAGRSRPAARRGQRAGQGAAEPDVGPEPDCAQADRDRARLRHSPHLLERLPHGLDRAQLRRAAVADQSLGHRRPVRGVQPADSGISRKGSRSRRSGGRFWVCCNHPPEAEEQGRNHHESFAFTSTPPARPAPARHVPASRRRGRSTSSSRPTSTASCSTASTSRRWPTTERSRAEAEIRALLFDLIAEESMPLSMSEREAFLGDVIDEVFGLGPLEPLLRDPTVSDILVNTYKTVYVERSGKLERHADDVPGRSAPAAGHRPDRERRRPARRRQLADGRRAPGGRLACERDHPAAGGRRTAALDPPLSGRAPAGRGSRRDPLADASDARIPRGVRPRAS